VKGDRLAFVDGFATTFFTAGDKLVISEQQRAYAAITSPKGTLDCITAFGRTGFRDDVAKIQIPTLVVHGDSDAIVPFEVSGKRSHEAIAGSELVVIEGGPHGVNATHPAEFNKAPLAFLAK
jgi:non-heme chloroperoxidase